MVNVGRTNRPYCRLRLSFWRIFSAKRPCGDLRARFDCGADGGGGRGGPGVPPRQSLRTSLPARPTLIGLPAIVVVRNVHGSTHAVQARWGGWGVRMGGNSWIQRNPRMYLFTPTTISQLSIYLTNYSSAVNEEKWPAFAACAQLQSYRFKLYVLSSSQHNL